MVDVFISYKSERRKAAAHLAKILVCYGYTVWYDYNLVKGRDFAAQIDAKIREAKAVVVLWCSLSVRSEWVPDEAALAAKLGTLVPAKIEACELRVDFARKHYLDLTLWGGAPRDHALDALLAALEQKVRRAPQQNFKAITEYEEVWRRFGAPSLKAFALNAPVHAEPPEPLPFLPWAGKTKWFKDIENGPEMVIAPPGNFMMGSPEDEPERESWKAGTESPQHKVAIPKPFAIGRCVVTVKEYLAAVHDSGCRLPEWLEKGSEYDIETGSSDYYKKFGEALNGDAFPIVGISWDDAHCYAAWLSKASGARYRLPSEAEWEYACRAGSVTPFWWGSSVTPHQANYDGSAEPYDGGGRIGEFRKRTVPAKHFEPNPWGLYQVHGNVWEWVEDCWHASYNGAPTDGSAWTMKVCANRGLRGGCWEVEPKELRAASRHFYSQNDRGSDVGFRVARTLD